MPMRGCHALVDYSSPDCNSFTPSRRYGYKENRSISRRVMEHSYGRRNRAKILCLSDGIQGTQAVLLPRHAPQPSVRTRRANSRLNGALSGASTGANSLRTRDAKQRKLVLHFDARNTVLVADTVTQIGVKEAFNSYLTGVTWGYEANDGTWEWVSDTPSLTSPARNAITYYKHRERELVRVPSDRGRLRKVTGDFTQEPLGERFHAYLEKGLSSIKWTHEEHNPQLIMVDKDGEKYHYILPAVFQLIQHLQDTKRDFSIVIRTYGMDAPNILKAISSSLQGLHPDFPRLSEMPVNHSIGSIKRLDNGQILLSSDITGQNEPITSEREMYRALSETEGVCALVDDFLHWQNNEYLHTSSKPHWVDLHDDSVQHIIFDDNLRVTDTDGIVDLRLFRRHDDDVANSVLDLVEMQRYEDACLVQADLLQSTCDLNYFVDKVKVCEQNYDTLIKEREPS